MTKQASENLQRITQYAETDAEYLCLFEDYQESVQQMQSILDHFSEEELSVIMDLIGTSGALDLRLLELVCFLMEFKD